MDHRWKAFVNLSVRAFAVIRNNMDLVTDFIEMVWKPMPSAPDVRGYLHKSLYVGLNIVDACKKLKKKFEQAPFKTKTRFKNAMHHLATK